MRVPAAAALLIAGLSSPALAEPAGAESGQQQRDRIVCRRAVQTATRMGARRACRPESEWRTMRDGRPVDDRVAEDSDTLATMNDRISTGCLGGNSAIPQE